MEPQGLYRGIELIKRYSIVLADPPWSFRNWSADEPGQIHVRSRGANKHYPTITTEDICLLKPPAATNAALFLWTTGTHLPDALRVIDAWGFVYVTKVWEWVKMRRSGFGVSMGMGYYTRMCSEPCLLAVRGKMPVEVHDELALIMAPVGKHSCKPEEQYRKIDRLYPPERYPDRLEMFARRQMAGWDVFGNEVAASIEFRPPAVSLTGYEERLLTLIRDLGGRACRPVSIHKLSAELGGQSESTIRYWMRKLQDKDLIRKPSPRGGWLAVA